MGGGWRGGSPALCHWTIVASQSCPHRTCHLCLCVCGGGTHVQHVWLAVLHGILAFSSRKTLLYSSRKAMAPLLCEGYLKYKLLFPWKLLSWCYGSTAWIPLAFVRGKKWKWKSFSPVWLFETPWTVACQAPLSMGFPRQECWSGLPFPSPGDLPDPGIEPTSPPSYMLLMDSLPSKSLGKLKRLCSNPAKFPRQNQRPRYNGRQKDAGCGIWAELSP